jgi:hypothetical protein
MSGCRQICISIKKKFNPFGAGFASTASPWVAPTVIEITLFQSRNIESMRG